MAQDQNVVPFRRVGRPYIDPRMLQRLNGGAAMRPARPVKDVRPGLGERLVIWARLNASMLNCAITTWAIGLTLLLAAYMVWQFFGRSGF